MKKILGFIPARGGSKGIPKKNLFPIGGKQLIAYSIEESLKSKINRVIVSTNSDEIADVSKSLGAEIPFLRPEEFSGDKSTIEDAIEYTLNRLEKEEGYIPDLIILLHPTTPLRRAIHIDECIELLIKENADSVISVSEPMEHPADMVYWEKGEMKFLLPGVIPGKTQRQDFPECFFINGCVYVFTYASFMEKKSRYGKKNLPYHMSQLDSIDIDSMNDMIIAEALMLRRNADNTHQTEIR